MSNPETALAVRQPQAPEPFEPENLEQAFALAKDIAQAAIVPAHLRGRPHDAYVILLFGRELGLAPMQSMLNVDMVEGRPRLNAQMTVGLVKRSPVCRYFRLVESSDEIATYETLRVGEPEPTRLTFTIQQAQKADLVRKTSSGAPNNWMKHPAAMLRHRAAQSLARAVYPDLLGNLYDDDEIDEIRETVAREQMQAPPAPPAKRPAAARPTIDVTSSPSPARAEPPANDAAPRREPARRPTIPPPEPTKAEDEKAIDDLGRAVVGPKPDDTPPAASAGPAPAPAPAPSAPAPPEDDYRPIERLVAEMYEATEKRKEAGPVAARAAVDAVARKVANLASADVTEDEKKWAREELTYCRDLIAGKVQPKTEGGQP